MLRELKGWGLEMRDARQAGLTGIYLRLFREPLLQLENPLDWKEGSCREGLYRADQIAWLFNERSLELEELCDRLLKIDLEKKEDVAEPCPICLESLLEKGRPLSGRDGCPCLFHTSCLETYLDKRDGCPNGCKE